MKSNIVKIGNLDYLPGSEKNSFHAAVFYNLDLCIVLSSIGQERD
jgi:hypothetical protein